MVKRVSICVTTYKRPKLLKKTLESVSKLTFKKNKKPHITIIVVDNDPEGSAYHVFDIFTHQYPWRLKYYIEKKRGISFARNTAIRYAKEFGDYTAFIDDDSYADPHWLDELLAVLDEYSAEVVRGPILWILPPDVPSWILKGKFFQCPSYKTGTLLSIANSSGVLFSNIIIANNDTPFDPRWALTGGEDTHFFRIVSEMGHKIVYANDAIVFEKVPESKANMQWLIKRAYRSSITFTTSQMILKSRIRIFPRRMGIAIVRIILGILMVVTTGFLGRHILTKGLRHIVIGCGTVAAFLGMQYQEYRVIHGE